MADSKVDKDIKHARNALKRAYREQFSEKEVARLEKNLEEALAKKDFTRNLHRARI